MQRNEVLPKILTKSFRRLKRKFTTVIGDCPCKFSLKPGSRSAKIVMRFPGFFNVGLRAEKKTYLSRAEFGIVLRSRTRRTSKACTDNIL